MRAVNRHRLPVTAVLLGSVAGLLSYTALPVFEGYVAGVAGVVGEISPTQPQQPALVVSFGAAFLIGLSMNFLPCNLPIVMSLLPATTREESRLAFVRKTGLYSVGAVAVLGTLGALLGLLGGTVAPLVRSYAAVGPYVAGVVVGGVGLLSVLWGLGEFGVVELPAVPVSLTEPLRDGVADRDGAGGYLLLGAVYGGTGGGCPLPTYNLLLLWVVLAADPVYGATLLGVYVLGRILPVAAVGAVLGDRPQRAADVFGGRYGTLRTVNGTVLVGIGSLLVVFTGLRAVVGAV